MAIDMVAVLVESEASVTCTWMTPDQLEGVLGVEVPVMRPSSLRV
jgi:hypothetical protein